MNLPTTTKRAENLTNEDTIVASLPGPGGTAQVHYTIEQVRVTKDQALVTATMQRPGSVVPCAAQTFGYRRDEGVRVAA